MEQNSLIDKWLMNFFRAGQMMVDLSGSGNSNSHMWLFSRGIIWLFVKLMTIQRCCLQCVCVIKLHDLLYCNTYAQEVQQILKNYPWKLVGIDYSTGLNLHQMTCINSRLGQEYVNILQGLKGMQWLHIWILESERTQSIQKLLQSVIQRYCVKLLKIVDIRWFLQHIFYKFG